MSVLRNTMRLLRSIPPFCASSGLRGQLAATRPRFHSKRFILTSVNCGSAGVRIHENFIPATSWNTKTCRRFHPCRCQNYADQDMSQGTKLHEKLAEKNYDTIDVDLVENGTVGVIYLDRQQALNALSEALMYEVVDACQTFESIEEVGAIVITGKGKAFAAGADIKEMKDKTFEDAHKTRLFSHWNAVTALRTPIIAAVNGFALGGGCELAMACDIILAGEKALFGQPEVKLGTIPGFGGTQRLIREVGKSRAMEMILTGKAFMNAEEAAQRGLVSRVVPGDNETLVAEAIKVAKSIAELSRPTIAMAKEAVNAAYELGLSEGVKREHSLFCATFALEDQKEGMAAFAEKRDPQFKHK
ncbi:hypothetical protein Mapa_007246 [Marchantia paleacea]|nr:hypothetical protein Mapa_007246 [Marchantia paleacea]